VKFLTPKDVSDNIQKLPEHATNLRLVTSQKNKNNNISDSNACLLMQPSPQYYSCM